MRYLILNTADSIRVNVYSSEGAGTYAFIDLISSDIVHLQIGKRSKLLPYCTKSTNNEFLVSVTKMSNPPSNNIGNIFCSSNKVYNNAIILTDKERTIFLDQNPEFFV